MATLGKFELPNRLIKEEETATDKYAKFIADPFESAMATLLEMLFVEYY